jgi:hypothetical protein
VQRGACANRAGYCRTRNAAVLDVILLRVAIQEGFAFAATQGTAF